MQGVGIESIREMVSIPHENEDQTRQEQNRTEQSRAEQSSRADHAPSKTQHFLSSRLVSTFLLLGQD